MSSLDEIIRSMSVEPEFLELLSDEQKEVLFRKIREEQVRRWNKKEKELDRSQSPKRSQRKVKFLNGADEKPWVWVMGEHRDDLPYEKLVQQREKEKQEQERRSEILEAKNFAMQEISVIQGFEAVSVAEHGYDAIPESPEMGLIRTESLTGGSNAIPESPEMGLIRTESLTDTTVPVKKRFMSRSMARTTSIRSARAAMGTTSEQKKEFEEKRVEEVLGTLRRSKSVAIKRARELEQRNELCWKESLRRGNMHQRSRQRSFAAARTLTEKTPNIHEKILDLASQKKKEFEQSRKKPARVAPCPPDKRRLLKRSSFVQVDSAPKSATHVLTWFNTVEAPNGVGKDRDGTISVWFHGKLGREAASKILEKEVFGSYLVRLSAKLWGYTVSVKTHVGSCHFLVDASSGQYHFLGPKQQKLRTLSALLEYYKTNPVTWDGQEFLLIPVGLEDDLDVFRGLYGEEADEDDGSTL